MWSIHSLIPQLTRSDHSCLLKPEGARDGVILRGIPFLLVQTLLLQSILFSRDNILRHRQTGDIIVIIAYHTAWRYDRQL